MCIRDRTLTYQLEKEGFAVDSCLDGEEACYYMEEGLYDLILLDRMLPKLDGIGVLTEMRKKGDMTPVIMLTALGALTAVSYTHLDVYKRQTFFLLSTSINIFPFSYPNFQTYKPTNSLSIFYLFIFYPLHTPRLCLRSGDSRGFGLCDSLDAGAGGRGIGLMSHEKMVTFLTFRGSHVTVCPNGAV